MKETISRALARYRSTFADFTIGQKVVSVVGTGALLLGGFMVFSWASEPAYSPLFSGLSSSDASAVIDHLDASGVPYELTDGGSTVMVPQDDVYKTRIVMSGEGLPASSTGGGYALLDNQGLSTSQFQEQTDFKRAMEGELANTIEAIDDVNTAVVHLAMPEKQVFADAQQPTTASVLVGTRPGTTLDGQQVQAVIHLVASSIDGLAPEMVTVADSTGRVLSSPDGSGGADGSTRDQQTQAVQSELHDRLQSMLDRVVGPGNSTVQVTASLDFDKSVTETTDYQANPDMPPMSSSTSKEVYQGPGSGAAAGGVVGPDGQMDSTYSSGAGGDSSYKKSQTTEDNAVDTVVEKRETAPGAIKTLHVGIALDSVATQNYSPGQVRGLVSDTVGINKERGDTVRVVAMPFDRTAETAAADELALAQAADAAAARNDLYRKGGLGFVVGIALLLAFAKSRKRAAARDQATTYVVEQLRQESAARATLETSAASLALGQAERSEADGLQQELDALIERQPEDVAALLRGWLTEKS